MPLHNSTTVLYQSSEIFKTRFFNSSQNFRLRKVWKIQFQIDKLQPQIFFFFLLFCACHLSVSHFQQLLLRKLVANLAFEKKRKFLKILTTKRSEAANPWINIFTNTFSTQDLRLQILSLILICNFSFNFQFYQC